MGEKRDAYVAKMGNKLRKWSAEIDKMEAKAREVGVGSLQDFQKQVVDLQCKRKEINHKLEDLRHVGEAKWRDMKTDVDSAWKILDKAVHSAMATFKESSLPEQS